MGYIEKLPSGKYSIRFWYHAPDGGRKQKRLSGFRTQQEAKRAEYEFRAKQETLGESVDITFEQLFERYKAVALNELKTGSYVGNESKLRLYVIPFFKHRLVNKMKPKDIIDWKQHLETEYNLSYAYKKGVFYSFSAMMRFANTYLGINNDALKKAGNFVNKELPKERLFWTEDEFLAFIGKVDNLVYKALFALLFLTGCRRGEALALCWDDYDGQSIRITKSVNYKSSKQGKRVLGYEITTPKNKHSIRTVYLPENVCELLNHLKTQAKGEFIFHNHSPLPKSTVQRAFDKYIKIAKVKKIRIHDLRHSHATMLFHKGVDILQIARRLGHADVSQLLNRYAHLLPEKEKALIDTINFSLKT